MRFIMSFTPQEIQKALDTAIIALAKGIGSEKLETLANAAADQGLQNEIGKIAVSTERVGSEKAKIDAFEMKMREAARAYFLAEEKAHLSQVEQQIRDQNKKKFGLLKDWLEENKAVNEGELAAKPHAAFAKAGLQAIKRADEKANNLSELKENEGRIRFGVNKKGESKATLEGDLDVNGLEKFLKEKFGEEVIEKKITRKDNGKTHFEIPLEDKDGHPVSLYDVMKEYKEQVSAKEKIKIIDFPDKKTAEERMTKPAHDDVKPEPPASPTPSAAPS